MTSVQSCGLMLRLGPVLLKISPQSRRYRRYASEQRSALRAPGRARHMIEAAPDRVAEAQTIRLRIRSFTDKPTDLWVHSQATLSAVARYQAR